MEELVEDGDEIICLRVVDKDSKISSNASVEQGIYKSEARNLLQRIQAKNVDNKAINLVLDLAIGKVPDTIQRMVSLAILSDCCSLVLFPTPSFRLSFVIYPFSHPTFQLSSSRLSPFSLVQPVEKTGGCNGKDPMFGTRVKAW